METTGETAGEGPGWQVEHRYRAVMEVLDGAPVSEVAVQYGVSRQSVYAWRDRYAAGGIDGLRDASRRPRTSPSRLPADADALVVRAAPGASPLGCPSDRVRGRPARH